MTSKVAELLAAGKEVLVYRSDLAASSHNSVKTAEFFMVVPFSILARSIILNHDMHRRTVGKSHSRDRH